MVDARLQDVNDFLHYRIYQFQHQNKSDYQRKRYSFQSPKRKNDHQHYDQDRRHDLYSEISFMLKHIRKAASRVFEAFAKIFYALRSHKSIIPQKNRFSNAE